MEPKKSLMERYGIPINQLDFGYVKECKDARKMEKIVQILRSGEEGYYPDLTQCAEDKLRELKPNSRQLRREEMVLKRQALPMDELKPIYEWNHDIKNTDRQLDSVDNNKDMHMVPIRKAGSISSKQQMDKAKEEKETKSASKKTGNGKEKIASTDYRKWDKYDADVEVLRIELEEERQRESVEIKNRRNQRMYGGGEQQEATKETSSSPQIEDITMLEQLSDIEKEKLAEGYRLCGNDYFRAKEYNAAKQEYTKAIGVNPEKAVFAYSNRALCNIRLKLYPEAIEDSELCLRLDPVSVKGRLRLAEATRASGRGRESYELFLKVIEIDPKNVVALKALEELREEFGNIPPPNATRLMIEENPLEKPQQKKEATVSKDKAKGGNSKVVEPAKVEKAPVEKSRVVTKVEKTPVEKSRVEIDYDLAELVKPNCIVPSKMSQMAETLSKGFQATNSSLKKKQQQQQQQPPQERKILIEEIQ